MRVPDVDNELRDAAYAGGRGRVFEDCAAQEVAQAERVAGVLQDCVFLGLVMVLSLVLYLPGLGFYSDDWAFLKILTLSEDQTLGGVIREFYANEQNVRMRPIQALYQAGLYWLFGLDPLGYHLVNAAVLLVGIVLFYLVLRRLGMPRALAISAPLIYGLLPHYSTDRFWFAGFQIGLSMTLYFFSFYAELRALHAKPTRLWSWRLLALGCMLVSTLGYEVFIPLYAVTPLLVWYRGRQIYSAIPGRPLVRTNLFVLAVPTLLALIGVMLYKAQTTTRLNLPSISDQIRWFVDLLSGAVRISYGTYGLGLPRVLWRIGRDHLDWTSLLVASVTGLICFCYIARVTDRTEDKPIRQRHLLGSLAIGLVVFVLGYSIFLLAKQAQNSSTGISNRVAIAGSIGVALTFTSAIGFVAWLLPSRQLQRRCFAALVALLCASNVLVINTIGSFWTAAYQQEQMALEGIKEQFPTLPSGSTLILDGVCPYAGPAIVFDASWDLSGALRTIYRDYTLQADTITPNLHVEDDGLVSSLYYGSIVTRYPYGRMFVYHAGHKTVHPIPDARAAHAYLMTYNPDRSGGCPRGVEGHGVPIF